MKKQTQSIRIQVPMSPNREHSVPLYLTSSFTFEDAEQSKAVFAEEMEGNIYSRFMNPNVDEFVSKMCVLENAEDGIAFSTGMAAIFASMAGLLKSGDHIIASKALFGSAIQILTKITTKWGIECTFVTGSDLDAWKNAIKPKAVPKTVPGVPLVQSASEKRPILGKGEYQAPQKRITPNMLTSNIIPYSDRNNNAQRIPEYSV